jgi:ribose/xylose/arabinose/galactoside ABC-type transport system permease subunit
MTSPPDPAKTSDRPKPSGRRIGLPSWLTWIGPALGLIAVWALFAALTPPGTGFTGWENQRLMLLQTAIVAAAAVGATFVIISGGIDLSVGSAIALGTVVVAGLLRDGAPVWLAGLGGVASGMVTGLAIGGLVIGHVLPVLGLLLGLVLGWVMNPSLVGVCITALGLALTGIGCFRLRRDRRLGLILMAGGVGVAALLALLLEPVPAEGSGIEAAPAARLILPCVAGTAAGGVLALLAALTRLRIPLSPFIVTLAMWGGLRGIAKGLGDSKPVYVDGDPWLFDLMVPATSGPFHYVAPGVVLVALLAVGAAVVLGFTRFGRHVVAIGSNEQTARLCGVAVESRKVQIYVLASACAGLAAVLQGAYLTMGDPTTAEGLELRVIAAVVIGGASLSGGQGSISGTLIGALIMTVVANGCTQLGLENWVQEVVTGAIIVAAVSIDMLRHRCPS